MYRKTWTRQHADLIPTLESDAVGSHRIDQVALSQKIRWKTHAPQRIAGSSGSGSGTESVGVAQGRQLAVAQTS